MPDIKLPQVGKATSLTVRKWRKKAGDAICKGDILLEIETDDGLAEVEASLDGTLSQIIVAEGRSVAPHTVVAKVGGAVNANSPTPVQQAKPMSQPSNKATPATPAGKVTPVVMPKAGQSMEEGVLVKWHVKPGDIIKQGQIIFEIETDKATMDVEATDSGRLARIVLQEGQVSKVLEPVAYLANNDADADAVIAASGAPAAAAPAAAQPTATSAVAAAPSLTTAPAPTTDGTRVKASPAARKAAAEMNVDLTRLGMGSGPGGRVLSTDVQLAAQSGSAAAATAPVAATPAVPASAPLPQTGEGGVTRRRMSQMRKAIAKNLSISKQTIPHFYIKAMINAEPLHAYYQAEKAKYPCSLNDVVIMAAAKAIRQFPQFRSRIEGDEILEFPSVNIGVAVRMDDGLVVPVLVNADQMTLKQIGAESKRIANSARAGKIEGMGKGLFTISNMGMFGVEEFSAIINPPESAILAVGTIREEVIVSGGTLRPGKVMTLTLSVDHRVIDGSLAAKFMARLKELLEWPGQME